MVEERRNDIGYKTTFTMLTSALAILLGLFVHAAWSTANEGQKIGHLHETRITRVESKFDAISNDLNEIKLLLKRNIPIAH